MYRKPKSCFIFQNNRYLKFFNNIAFAIDVQREEPKDLLNILII